MVRDYQPKKKNPYFLEPTLYKATLAIIRDYERIKTEYDNAICGSPQPGQPSGTGIGDPVNKAAVKRLKMEERLKAVEQALANIPGEYRRGIMDNIMYEARYPRNADRGTYSRWKARFVYKVAKKMNWI